MFAYLILFVNWCRCCEDDFRQSQQNPLKMRKIASKYAYFDAQLHAKYTLNAIITAIALGTFRFLFFFFFCFFIFLYLL